MSSEYGQLGWTNQIRPQSMMMMKTKNGLAAIDTNLTRN